MNAADLLRLRTTALCIIVETVNEANDLRFQLSVIKVLAETALRPDLLESL